MGMSWANKSFALRIALYGPENPKKTSHKKINIFYALFFRGKFSMKSVTKFWSLKKREVRFVKT